MTLIGQAATAYDYRTAKESLARIRLFIDEAMGGMWGPECETEATMVLAEYEIVADRIERLATNKAASPSTDAPAPDRPFPIHNGDRPADWQRPSLTPHVEAEPDTTNGS